MSIRNTTHGLSSHPLHNIWRKMLSRCYTRQDKAFGLYGARGIKICPEWISDFKTFYDWAITNGWKRGLEIDRRDNDLGYSPANCRIVTRKINSRNRRSNRIIEYNGEKRILIEWCENLGLNYATINARLNNYNWSIEKAFSTPTKKSFL